MRLSESTNGKRQKSIRHFNAVFYSILQRMCSWIRILILCNYSSDCFYTRWLSFNSTSGSPLKYVQRIQVPYNNCGSKLRDECNTHRNSLRIGRHMHIRSSSFTYILWFVSYWDRRNKEMKQQLLLMGILKWPKFWN